MTVHVVLPPRPVLQSVCWWTECTCGDRIIADTADEVREQGRAHRGAGVERAEQEYNRERDEARQLRRTARREHRQVKRGAARGP